MIDLEERDLAREGANEEIRVCYRHNEADRRDDALDKQLQSAMVLCAHKPNTTVGTLSPCATVRSAARREQL
jgi:hypothetical protein